MQITYQKNDGCVFQRYRNTILPYKIGETTSMGWKVLNIKYEYNNKYYSENEFNKLIQKSKNNFLKKRQNQKQAIEELKKFMYYFGAMLIINFLKMLLGM